MWTPPPQRLSEPCPRRAPAPPRPSTPPSTAPPTPPLLPFLLLPDPFSTQRRRARGETRSSFSHASAWYDSDLPTPLKKSPRSPTAPEPLHDVAPGSPGPGLMPAPPPSAGPDPAATRLAYDQATPAAPGAPPSGLLASRPRAWAAVSVAFATTHDARLPTRVLVNLLPLPSQPKPRDHGLCPSRPPPRPSACQWGSVPEATQRARGEAERRWRTLPRRGPRGAPAAVRPQSRCTPPGTRPSRLPLLGSFQSTTASTAEHPLQLDFLICTTGLEQNTLCSCYES